MLRAMCRPFYFPHGQSSENMCAHVVFQSHNEIREREKTNNLTEVYKIIPSISIIKYSKLWNNTYQIAIEFVKILSTTEKWPHFSSPS